LTAATLVPTDRRSSPDDGTGRLPPELEALVARATAFDKKDRVASARDLHDAIERYLDGERDAERRKELARSHTSRAAAALAEAGKGGPEAQGHRERALRDLGSAVAIDPMNGVALKILVDALLDAPDALPEEAERELADADLRDRAIAAKNATLVYALMGLTIPIFMAMPIRRPVLLSLLVVASLAVLGFMAWLWRSARAEPWTLYVSVPLSFVLVGLMGTIFGPFVMVPGTAAVTVAGFLVGVRADRQLRRLLLAAGLTSVFLPAALQFAGVTPLSYVFEPGGIRIVSNLVEFRPGPALLLLAVSSATTLIATVLTVGRAVELLVRAERRNFARAFRLRQMLPRAATEATGAR
jgi:serine/threonine-protein kinase